MKRFLSAIVIVCAGLAHLSIATEQAPDLTPTPNIEKADALFQSAKRYHDGNGVTQDYANAHRLYARAAALGSTDAHVNLGYMYFVGEGVTPNYKIAYDWYIKAADAGSAEARENLAMMYENGLGVSKDPAAAKRWRDGNINANVTPTQIDTLKPTPTSPQTMQKDIVQGNSPASESPVSKTVDVAAAPQLKGSPADSVQTPTPAASLARYTAPQKTGLAIGVTLGLFALLHLLWCARAYWRIQLRKRDQAFAKAFFQDNMDTLRLIYLRRQTANQAMLDANQRWAVTVCAQMIRFAKTYKGANPFVRAKARAVTKALKKGAYDARASVYPLIAILQPQILANIKAVDNFRAHGNAHNITLPKLKRRPQLRIIENHKHALASQTRPSERTADEPLK